MGSKWVDTPMYETGSLVHTLQVGLQRDWAIIAMCRDKVEVGVQLVLSCEQCLFFPFTLRV